ncbi:Oligopeptidase A [Serratia symbiotica]|nr:Oligopeptidase A [Serratia symbiotica]
MNNPLLTSFYLPPFSKIDPKHILPAIQFILLDCRKKIESIISLSEKFTWNNLCQPLSEIDNRLLRIWSLIEHLNAVKNSTELRVVYEKSLLLISEYTTWIGQNKKIYQAYHNLKNGKEFDFLTTSQKKFIENTLRDFKLSGINLSKDKKNRYGEIVSQLSKLSYNYSNNVLDATMNWNKLITDKTQLNGLPLRVLEQAKKMAISKNKIGWLLTLDMPSYLSIITYSENRELRKEIYHAFATRASDQGLNPDKWDNTVIMEEILELRYELSQLLGFKNFAEKSLSTKMAKNVEQVIKFLVDLSNKVRPKAQKELEQLCIFAKKYDGLDKIEAWDIIYYSEKQKKYLFSIDNEKLRTYFPENIVINGLFEIIKRIYNITIKERYNVDIWHSSVRFFDLFDIKNKLCGSFYLDLYSRKNKRSGAWMSDCICKFKKSNGTLQNPVAYIICNFNNPLNNQPKLFTHNEVITLFHEFGHALHHTLTQIETLGVSGINGVPWDAIELPSQLMENWCWEPEALKLISNHYKNNQPLTENILDNIFKSKHYQTALFILRQLELGLFDFLIHIEHITLGNQQILKKLQEVRKFISILPSPDWNRFSHSFSHIFSGGYSAGYYSYLWAEVLSADAFSLFKEKGIFNSKIGQSFLQNILTQGGSEEPMELFKRFRGRKPKLDSILYHYGIKN